VLSALFQERLVGFRFESHVLLPKSTCVEIPIQVPVSVFPQSGGKRENSCFELRVNLGSSTALPLISTLRISTDKRRFLLFGTLSWKGLDHLLTSR
jgi:hypothetical protein